MVSISSVSKHWPAIPASTRTGDQRRKERLSSPTVLTSLRDSCFYSVGFLCLGITPHNSILHFPFLCLGRKQNHHLSPLQRVFSLRRKKKNGWNLLRAKGLESAGQVVVLKKHDPMVRVHLLSELARDRGSSCFGKRDEETRLSGRAIPFFHHRPQRYH